MIVSSLNQVTINVTPVERVMDMLSGFLTSKSTMDFIIVETVYIRDATIMRKNVNQISKRLSLSDDESSCF